MPEIVKRARHRRHARPVTIDTRQTQGIAPLREKASEGFVRGVRARDVGEVLITSGVSGGLLLAILATIDPGDEAIFLDPYFVMYKHLLTLVGGKPVLVDSYPDFRLDFDKIRSAITPRTKVILCNSPANPTGTVLSDEETRAAGPTGGRNGRRPRQRRNLPHVLLRPTVCQPGPLERADDRHRRFQQVALDDRMAARLCPRAGRGHPADDQAAAVHFRLRAQPVQWAGVTACDVEVRRATVAEYRLNRDFMLHELGELLRVRPAGGAVLSLCARRRGGPERNSSPRRSATTC